MDFSELIPMLEVFLELFPDKIEKEEAMRKLLVSIDSLIDNNTNVVHRIKYFLINLKNLEHIFKENDKLLLIYPCHVFMVLLNFLFDMTNITCVNSVERDLFTKVKNSMEEQGVTIHPVKEVTIKNWDVSGDGFQCIMVGDCSKKPAIKTLLASTLLANEQMLLSVSRDTVTKCARNDLTHELLEHTIQLENFKIQVQNNHFAFKEISAGTEESYNLELICRKRVPPAATLLKARPQPQLNNNEEFECPVCFLELKAPVSSCSNGHNLCGTCRESVKSCPTCKVELFFRNLSLEKLVEGLSVACKGYENGCDKWFTSRSVLEVHELNCDHIINFNCKCKRSKIITKKSEILKHILKHKTEAYYRPFNIDLDAVSGLEVVLFFDRGYSSNRFEFSTKKVKDMLFIYVILFEKVENKGKYLVEVSATINSKVDTVKKVVPLFDEVNDPFMRIPLKYFEMDHVQLAIHII